MTMMTNQKFPLSREANILLMDKLTVDERFAIMFGHAKILHDPLRVVPINQPTEDKEDEKTRDT